jgi:hypothetical protein
MTPRSHGRSSIAGLRSAYYMARVTVALVIGSLNSSEPSKTGTASENNEEAS